MKNFIENICLPLFTICLLLTAPGFAQDLDDVTISGRVTDANGLVLVGATVTATQVGTGVDRTVTTNDEGRYRIIELQPGIYQVKAAATGFGSKIKTDLETISGQNVQLDFQLAPADVQAETTVAVTDEDASPVDTTRTVVGGTVTQREIEDLPNTTRNPLDLVFTLGGVTEEPLSTRDLSDDKGGRDDSVPRNSPEEAGIFALSGGAAYSNNITIDGFDNNDDRAATFRFQPSIETIEEVQVITNQFSAEYGRASGGRVNLRTRAGSNKFRGRAYYFFNDESLNANSWSNNRRGVPRTSFQRHIPGFTLSGPVPFGYFKNRTYFSAGYEYDNTLDTTLTDTYIPVQQNPGFPLPVPTSGERITDFGVVLGRYVFEGDTPRREHIFSTRVDHNFTDKHNITVGYQLGRLRDRRQFRGGNSLPEALIGRVRNTDAINFTDNYVFNSKAVNQFRFQYSELRPELQSAGQEQNPVVLISFREPTRTSNTTLVAGASTLGSSDRIEKRFQLQDTFSYIAGDHTLRFGFDTQRVDSTFIDLTDVGGTYNFSNPSSGMRANIPQCNNVSGGAAAFLNNCVSRARQNFFTDSSIQNTYFGIFGQDDWRLRPNLSVSLGLRYERESVIDDNNNWGPRFAVAWNPFPKSSKTVIRFGTGIFYNRVLLRTVDDYQRGSNEIIFDTNRVPFGTQRESYLRDLSSQFPNRLTPDSPIIQRYINEGFNRNDFFRQLDPTLKIPESYQFNLGFEREISNGFVFEVNATYNRTLRLWREFNSNAPVVPAGFTDLADYLANGITTGSTRFEFGSPTGPDSRTAVINGQSVTIYNLNTQSTSTSSSSVYGRAQSIANALRPDPTAGQVEQVASIGNSWYRGAVFELRRRYRRLGSGFASSVRMAYTFSKLEDDGVVNTSSAQISGNFAAEKSRSLLDRRHRFAVSGLLDTPWWLGKLRFAPSFRFGSSAPFNISLGGDFGDDRNLDDVNTDRPNFNGDLSNIVWRRASDPLDLNLLNSFTLAPIGRAGNLPRNAGKGPKQYIFDLTLSRQFKLTEKIRLRPSAEFYNILNMTVFSFGSEFINSTASFSQDPQSFIEGFLVPTRAYRPRQIRFGLRLDF